MALPPFSPSSGVLFDGLPGKIGQAEFVAATPFDLPFLRRLYRTTREEELAGVAWPEAAKQAFCDSQFDLQHTHMVRTFPQADFLVIRISGTPCGRLYVDGAGQSLHLVDIALMPQRRGHGLGAAILRFLQTKAAATGKPLTLQVAHNNPRAYAFYRKLGFCDESIGPTHRAMRWVS
jgi:ribosomal protein S18 acetylase RimI-like enzyme